MVAKNFNAQVERNFTSYPVGDEQAMTMEAIREECKRLAFLFDSACPDSREKSLALTNLEQAMFWVNAAIARPND